MTTGVTAVRRVAPEPALLDDLVAWLNHRFGHEDERITPESRLFAEGWIDSIGVLHLIAWVERALGTPIPDRMIRIDYFESALTIAERFFPSESSPAELGEASVGDASVDGTR